MLDDTDIPAGGRRKTKVHPFRTQKSSQEVVV